MDWSLTIVALALIAVAAVSKRLSGSPITPAILFVSIGLLVGPKVLDEIDIASTSSTERALAEATLALVLFSDASRIDLGAAAWLSVPLRLLGIGLPLTIALGALAAAVIFGELTFWEAVIVGVVLAPTDAALGQAVVTEPRVPRSDPPGPERRERAQRRDLRAAALRGRGGRRRPVGHLRGANRDDPSARGGRLRHRRRGRRRRSWSEPWSSMPAAGI